MESLVKCKMYPKSAPEDSGTLKLSGLNFGFPGHLQKRGTLKKNTLMDRARVRNQFTLLYQERNPHIVLGLAK